jgi:hypothetical protein
VPLPEKASFATDASSQLFFAIGISLSLSSISSNRASVTFLSCVGIP